MVALLFSGATGALAHLAAGRVRDRRRRLQFEVNRSVDRRLRHLLAPRRRRHLAVPRRAHRRPVPDRHRSAPTPHHDAKPYYAWLLLLEAGCLGVFVSLDLFLFFVMFEIVLVPMYFLIGGWGYADRVYAALKFFLFTMFGSALMLVGIVALAFLHRDARRGRRTGPRPRRSWPTPRANPSGARRRARSPSSQDGRAAHLRPGRDRRGPHGRRRLDRRRPVRLVGGRWIFLAFAIAFAVKVPLFPLHTWLPDAHTEAPTAGSVILAGVLLKLGTYGFVRFGLYLFPDAANFFAPALVTLGRDRHHLRRRRRHHAEGPQTARRLLVGGPPRASSCSARSPSPPRASRAGCCRWSTTASPPAPCSSWSA